MGEEYGELSYDGMIGNMDNFIYILGDTEIN